MALSGNLGFVPLDEVLRLLMRSDQRGAVEVRGEDVRGRIFVAKRGITLATTAEDRDLHSHLVNSGYVDDQLLRRVASGSATFSDLSEDEPAVVDLLREITVESVYRMKARGASFDVAEEATSPYASPRPFDLEAVLDDARRRADEWAEVERTISDLTVAVRINRFPGEGSEIKIGRDAWRVLSELGAGASVAQIAERLGTTEFWAARVVADMVDQGLVLVAEQPPVVEDSHQPEGEPQPDESWWVEPAETGPPAPTDELEEAEEEPEPEGRFLGHYISARPDLEVTPVGTGGEDQEPEADVEEDTEAFLEKVFSQIEPESEAEEEGHGLLRRRRLGSVLKEED